MGQVLRIDNNMINAYLYIHYEGGNGWDVHTHFYYYMYLLCPAANPQKQCNPIKMLPLNYFFIPLCVSPANLSAMQLYSGC